MEVARYTFKSPYPNQVQVGQPDPTVKQEEELKEQTNELLQDSNEALNEAKIYETSQSKEVTPTINSATLDIYA